MTAAAQIQCPKCGAEISISAALAAQVETSLRAEYRRKQQELETQIAAKEKSASEKLAIAEKQAREIEQSIAAQVAQSRVKLAAEIREQERAQAAVDTQAKIAMLEQQALEREKKLAAARQAEIAALKLQEQLQSDRDEWTAQKLRERAEIREQLRLEIAGKLSAESQTQIEMLKKQLDDARKSGDEMRRKLEQGSQQTQGEINELQLENLLRENFPDDEITPVPKGMNGADVIQTVRNRQNIAGGKIIWESKNTKEWAKNWLDKLKDDQRAINAELAIIVSAALPPEFKESGYGMQEGVFICEPRFSLLFAQFLRQRLLAVANERQMQTHRQDIKEQVYDYVIGTQFRQRIEAIIGYLRKEQDAMQKERNALEKRYAERQKHLEKIGVNLAGIYGDFSGLAQLQTIPALELPAPDI